MKKKQKTKVPKRKTKNNSKKKVPRDIFLDNYCGETGCSRYEAIELFGDHLEHGKMSYKKDYKKESPFDFLFKRSIESLLK